MTVSRTRVLVVDDSAFARKVVREVLAGDSAVEVVGLARDGLEALEKIEELRPDVVTLDLVMPHLDGLGVLRALDGRPRAPRVVVVSFGDAESEMGMEALRLGAVTLVHKPTNLAIDRLYELGAELLRAVTAAGAARSQGPSVVETPLRFERSTSTSKRLLVIGASTGGPQALTRLLTSLPGNLPLPVALVLHIPAGFTAPFAHRLNGECALEVVEASQGLEVSTGRVVVARAGMHLTLNEQGGKFFAHLDVAPLGTAHRPSVNELFGSAARLTGAGTLAVVLTGMGDDGLIGCTEIVKRGGTVLAEHASTCVVYGMPRVVAEAGLVTEQPPLGDMAAAVLRHL
jgi:two-component system chemotaxis response regulator CheB